MKNIFLTQKQDHTGPHYYVITKLVNDAKYKIGESLTVASVQDLCDQSGIWRVTITQQVTS